MGIKDLLSSADNLTAFLVASFLIFQGVRQVYRRTVGGKRDLRAKLDSLACGNPTEHVEAMFGTPVYRYTFTATMRFMLERETVERRLYETKYGWLTAHFIDNAVVAYVFTLTSKRFRYDLTLQSFGNIRGYLGYSTFAELVKEIPDDGELFLGASVVDYTEVSDFARPGRYQRYGLAATMSGWHKFEASFEDVGFVSWGAYKSTGSEGLEGKKPSLQRFRETAAPDTFAVFGQGYLFDTFRHPATAGSIDHDQLLLVDKANRFREERRRTRVSRILNMVRRSFRRGTSSFR